ncbi:MAG: DUF4124 domain-containing protein [Halioglobus sp.]|nr:DUF4124 domain-containing protein [Halioglobus sp.]
MKYMNITGVVLTTVLLAATPAPVSAQDKLYRWVDDQGNPVNSDRPPEGDVQYEIISTQSNMVRAVDVEASEPGASGAKSDPNTKDSDNALVDDRRIKIEKNPEYCETARSNLQQLNTKARIRMRDENGETRYLSEAERDEQRKNAENAIEVYCP